MELQVLLDCGVRHCTAWAKQWIEHLQVPVDAA
jgi:hypothetical protein